MDSVDKEQKEDKRTAQSSSPTSVQPPSTNNVLQDVPQVPRPPPAPPGNNMPPAAPPPPAPLTTPSWPRSDTNDQAMRPNKAKPAKSIRQDIPHVRLFNPKDLKLERKRLKRPEEIRKQVDVDRMEFFDRYQKYNYMPLVDSREYLRTLRAEIVSITFDGIEQLTDYFLISLHHCQLSLHTLNWISLAGCYNITDEGIYWISKIFPKLHTIQLFGCKKLTERSIHYLQKDNTNMKNIYMDGTSCCLVPHTAVPTFIHRSRRRKAAEGDLQVYVNGCPMISPLLSDIPSTAGSLSLTPVKYRKMVILVPDTLPCSPLAVLTNQKDISPSHDLIVKSDWLPFKDLSVANDHSTAEIINVFQIPKDKGITDLILSAGSIVMLPYQLCQNMAPTLAQDLATSICSVLTKHDDCTYVLLGLASHTDTTDYTQIVHDIFLQVQHKLKQWISRLSKYLENSIEINWRMASLDHQEQEVLSFGERLVRQGKLLYTENFKYKSSAKPMFTVTSSFLTYGPDRVTKATELQFLVDIMEADETYFSWNREKLQGHKVVDYCNNLHKKPVPLTSLNHFCKTNSLPDLSQGHMQMSKVMTYAAKWGQALYFPYLPENSVVTDFSFLADVFHRIIFTSAPKSCDLRCLGDGIPCWTQEDLKCVLKEKVSLLVRLLEKNGCLLKISTDPWSSLKDVSYVFVLYKDLPTKPAVSLERFWPEVATDVQSIQRDKYFFCCAGIPDSFFPNLLRHFMKLGGTTLLWRDGVVIQKGYLTILLEKITESQGLPAIYLGVRSPTLADKDLEKPVWATLKLYACVVDYLIKKYRIGITKCVPCVECSPKSRYACLQSPDTNRFFLEHVVRVGDERNVTCDKCLVQSESSLQVGPAIKLSMLVPGHDKEGKALPTWNTFNRCLMCENCATEGEDCPVNLRYGVRNWYCGCNRQGKLCDHCGMCQRCFLYIKKIVSIVEPKFEAPESFGFVKQDQMIAVDEINVTKKGSILGFITKDQEVKLSNCVLTPNYCPRLSVTVVKSGSFFIKLKMGHPKDTELCYDSDTGCVTQNGDIIQDKAVHNTCKTGSTVQVALSYTQSGFTEMELCLLLNDTVIFTMTTEAQEVAVTLNNGESEGVFLMVETPEKFRKEKVEALVYRISLKDFICSEEMRMWLLLKTLEEVCFGGRGISLSGAACVALPSHITLDKLKHATLYDFDKINYHHLCLTWNPLVGKKQDSITFKQKYMLEPDVSERQTLANCDTWNLTRLVHLLDAEGIPSTDVTTVDKKASFMFWTWHFLLASYPEMLLPSKMTKLLPTGTYAEERDTQIKEGLRSIVRMGFWRYFSDMNMTTLDIVYKGHAKKGFGKGEVLTANSKLVTYAMVFQDLVQNHLEEAGMVKIYSKFNKNLELFMCPGHCHVLRAKENIQDMVPELCGNYAIFLSFIDLSSNELTTIDDTFYTSLPNLVTLKINANFLSEIPESIKSCRKLSSLSVAHNDLEDLPRSLESLPYLHTLWLGHNRFKVVPEVIPRLTKLNVLDLSGMMLTELPEDIGNLVELKVIHIRADCFTELPPSFTKLTQLEEVELGGVPWAHLKKRNVMTYSGFDNFLMGNKMDRWLDANQKDRMELFRTFDENGNGILDVKELGNLSAAVFNLFPRFGYKGKNPPVESSPSGFPMEVLNCTHIRILHLPYQGFTKVPPEICDLVNLVDLDVHHNPNLLSIPAEISRIVTLKKLELDDCPLLKTPPREIRDKGFQSVYAYLQRLLSGATLSKRTKLMMVGLGGAGKTSLVKALLSDSCKAKLTDGEGITDGIDINTWNVHHNEDDITYNVWDFAGQTIYYNTHQFFLSTNRAIYVLLWNVRLGYEHAGLDFWLSSISVQAPKAPIFIVGSHKDQVNKIEIPIEEMQQRYPQIAGFHFVSSFNGEGIPELKEHLFTVTLQQQYMGERIPAVWLTFENNIAKEKKSTSIIDYDHAVGVANRSGIFEQSEIYQAIQFLHDLGIVQHFSNEYLKNKVVINPQWIVDVMACVVSVKNQVIHEGRLHHSDISTIWSAYPKKIHSWLLRLTEEFDLTFPLQDSPLNLVPCLLPEKKPQFEWKVIDKNSDIRENKMVYKFDYLPVGLFNRGQVRLHHLSDSGSIWKHGSFLRKNVHVALLQQTRDSELVVTAQGPRPENILFLVHEVFEGLIAESFNGVTYDFSMPCPECQKMMVKDQHMFDASTIRRAIDMKAPFLQCIKYFHTISCSDLQTLLPPDSHNDFDVHLVQCVQGLKDLRKDLAADIFISYCEKDGLLDQESYIVPSTVHQDLCDKGYKCWFKDKTDSQTTDDMAKALIDSSVFLAIVSMNYAQDEDCINIFKYARLTLRKAIVVVAIGDGFEWKQSKLGILLSDEVFINMIKPKREFYTSKFEELLNALSGKTRVVESVLAKPAVFFSYTWVNSAQAVSRGTKEIPGALGYGDPRELKHFLEDNGINCWIDVERVGMNGLFDDIAEGLLSAKVVIVCVSDEYAASPTCKIEFRYAANTLKLPIIIAVVGTGDVWRATEVGVLSIHFPIVNFQEKTKNGKSKLLKLIQDRLGEAEDPKAIQNSKTKSTDGHKNLSYMELFELAQRKLLRQLIFYAENQDIDVYPRLFVVDFLTEKDEDSTNIDNLEHSQVKEEKTKPRKPKPVLRRTTSTILPAYKLQKFCVYTLCEHDEGWHSVCEPLELPDDFGITSLGTFSPYLARMTTVMKYNKKLLLNCLTQDVGQSYIKWLEESPEATMSDYQLVYHMFREMVMAADTDGNMANLMRCHMTNGKTIWLCKDHRDSMNVTCLSNEDKSSHHGNDQDEKMNDWMLAGLRKVDDKTLITKFKTVGNGPRARDKKDKIKKQTVKKGKGTYVCNKCGESGHFVKECPQTKKGKRLKEKRRAVEDEADGGEDGDTAQKSILHKHKTKPKKGNRKAVNFAGEAEEITANPVDDFELPFADNDDTATVPDNEINNDTSSADQDKAKADLDTSSKNTNPLEVNNVAYGFSSGQQSRGSSASSSASQSTSSAANQMSSARRNRTSQSPQSLYKQNGKQGSRACVIS